MTLLDLARRNAWRKSARTSLLIFSVAVAFVIYGLTAGFLAGAQGAQGASDNRLVVTSKAGKSQKLPFNYVARIAAEEDVAATAYSARIRGFVEREKNAVSISAVDPQQMAAIFGQELGLTPDLLGRLDQARDRVLVGEALAQAQGWQVGQRIAVEAFQVMKSGGIRDWNFEIAGIFKANDPSVDTYFMMARYDYINAARARDKDTVDGIILLPRDGVSPGVLAQKIDASFANAGVPTSTQSEKQFLEAFIRQIADIGSIVDLVTGAAFMTILMIVTNTMVFAIRERTFEIGILKTIGFSHNRIMGLVFSETLFVFLTGTAIGLAGAVMLSMFLDATLGLAFPLLLFGKAIGLSIILGIASGLIPAINAIRLPIVKAFNAR